MNICVKLYCCIGVDMSASLVADRRNVSTICQHLFPATCLMDVNPNYGNTRHSGCLFLGLSCS